MTHVAAFYLSFMPWVRDDQRRMNYALAAQWADAWWRQEQRSIEYLRTNIWK